MMELNSINDAIFNEVGWQQNFLLTGIWHILMYAEPQIRALVQ